MSELTGKAARNRILVAGLLAGASVPGAEFIALSPWGHYAFFLWWWVAILATILGVVTASFVMMKLVFAIVRGWECTYWLNIFVASVVFVSLLVGGLRASHPMREFQFKSLATRSEPLISAVKTYTLALGSPPPNLSALVPKYLSEVPKTGIGVYPEYIYRTPGDADNPWSISVHIISGILDFDRFLYLPNGNYEESGFGYRKQIGDWAYIYD